jgi:GNAT superfamily N-acetyltransferase
MIEYVAGGPEDYAQVLDLQRQNHVATPGVAGGPDGFVSLAYTARTLDLARGPFHHVLAKSGAAVAGYALVLLREQGAMFSELEPMFAVADQALGERPYFVMGQVCVAQAYRGQGVFDGLYRALRGQMREHFPLVVTEVSRANPRSLRAHERIGFRALGADPASAWVVLAWDWRDA